MGAESSAEEHGPRTGPSARQAGLYKTRREPRPWSMRTPQYAHSLPSAASETSDRPAAHNKCIRCAVLAEDDASHASTSPFYYDYYERVHGEMDVPVDKLSSTASMPFSYGAPSLCTTGSTPGNAPCTGHVGAGLADDGERHPAFAPPASPPHCTLESVVVVASELATSTAESWLPGTCQEGGAPDLHQRGAATRHCLEGEEAQCAVDSEEDDDSWDFNGNHSYEDVIKSPIDIAIDGLAAAGPAGPILSQPSHAPGCASRRAGQDRSASPPPLQRAPRDEPHHVDRLSEDASPRGVREKYIEDIEYEPNSTDASSSLSPIALGQQRRPRDSFQRATHRPPREAPPSSSSHGSSSPAWRPHQPIVPFHRGADGAAAATRPAAFFRWGASVTNDSSPHGDTTTPSVASVVVARPAPRTHRSLFRVTNFKGPAWDHVEDSTSLETSAEASWDTSAEGAWDPLVDPSWDASTRSSLEQEETLASPAVTPGSSNLSGSCNHFSDVDISSDQRLAGGLFVEEPRARPLYEAIGSASVNGDHHWAKPCRASDALASPPPSLQGNFEEQRVLRATMDGHPEHRVCVEQPAVYDQARRCADRKRCLSSSSSLDQGSTIVDNTGIIPSGIVQALDDGREFSLGGRIASSLPQWSRHPQNPSSDSLTATSLGREGEGADASSPVHETAQEDYDCVHGAKEPLSKDGHATTSGPFSWEGEAPLDGCCGEPPLEPTTAATEHRGRAGQVTTLHGAPKQALSAILRLEACSYLYDAFYRAVLMPSSHEDSIKRDACAVASATCLTMAQEAALSEAIRAYAIYQGDGAFAYSSDIVEFMSAFLWSAEGGDADGAQVFATLTTLLQEHNYGCVVDGSGRGKALMAFQLEHLLGDIDDILAGHLARLDFFRAGAAPRWYATLLYDCAPPSFRRRVAEAFVLEGRAALHRLCIVLLIENRHALLACGTLGAISDVLADPLAREQLSAEDKGAPLEEWSDDVWMGLQEEVVIFPDDLAQLEALFELQEETITTAQGLAEVSLVEREDAALLARLEETLFDLSVVCADRERLARSCMEVQLRERTLQRVTAIQQGTIERLQRECSLAEGDRAQSNRRPR